ncbi:hypothetical protein L3X38_039542 [Prunus dulcis]|uniref:Strictosidine synthase conserved region domain-containing protein n=1 Tax=Prunus dulcis TaxID=3755 RepID=A0AAD4V8M8_PRUDU|nr:hypothetical protein L3X38_039542 [Prunus dulcis]
MKAANKYKCENSGLLNVTSEGEVKLLTDEAEGVKFGITDGVDVAVDDTIYFTDASYNYNLTDTILDILEGQSHRRFLSATQQPNRPKCWSVTYTLLMEWWFQPTKVT